MANAIFDIGNNVIVAGGSGLIGKAIYDAFQKLDSSVINADIRHGDAYFNQSQPETINNALSKLEVCPSVFVNVTYPRDFITHTECQLKVTQIVINRMINDGIHGSIINFGSIYGVRAPDYLLYENAVMGVPYPEYAMAKASLISMTWFLANKYKHNGIRINAISPGGVWNHQPQAFVRRYEKKARMLQPEDIVGTVLFLASSGSNFITGQNLIVDGGWTL